MPALPSRRAVLQGALGLTVALPFLETFATRARASGVGDRPKRFVLIHHMQGTVMNQWLPEGTERDWTLSPLLEPLAAFKDRMVVVAGLDNQVSRLNHSGNGHQRPNTTHLTAVPCRRDNASLADGPSFDQVLADRLYDGAPYRSIDLSVGHHGGTRDGTTRSPLHWSGSGTALTFLADPRLAYGRLFGVDDDQAAAERLRTRRASVLDGALAQFHALRPRLSTEDQRRLDDHADKLRDLERRVTAPPEGGCVPPSVVTPDGYDWAYDDDISGPLQYDLLVEALACGQARVGNILFRRGHNPEFPWLTVDGGPVVPKSRYDNWHMMVHDGREEPGLVAGFYWYAEQVALLLEKMDAAVDEDGDNLLDTTCVVWTTEFGNGIGHNRRKVPYVMFGHCGPQGGGRFLSYMNGGADDNWARSDYHHTQLYTSLLQLFGGSDESFGHVGDGVFQGPLPGLL
jgi:hypothetical protein